MWTRSKTKDILVLTVSIFVRADAQRAAASNRMASTSLIHETDLVVSINDLDNLFNSDEDDLAVSRDLGSRCNEYLITPRLGWWCICVCGCESLCFHWHFCARAVSSLKMTCMILTRRPSGVGNMTGIHLEWYYLLTDFLSYQNDHVLKYFSFLSTAWLQATGEWNGREIWWQGTKAVHFGPCVLH